MSNDDARPHEPALRYAGLAASVLRPTRRGEPDAPPPETREAAIAALASALGTRPGRVVRRRVVVGLGVAAVAVLVLGLVQFDRGGRVTVRLEGGPSLATGTVVRADSERPVSLSLSTGTRLRLSDQGRVRLAEIGARQHLVLEAGRLWANVSPLARHQRFLIGTPDAEIEVRGTAFEVVVAPEHPQCGRGVTQVNVSEGLVTVRRGNQLWQVAAGRSWPDACPPTIPPSSAHSVPPAVGIDAAVSKSGSPISRAKPLVGRKQRGGGATSSNLREQNDLFAAAMDARRRGDVAAARRALDALLARFPFGALAETARAELAAVRTASTGVADAPP